jgi:hypothetical protein
MDIPIISDRTGLTLDEAKKEYVELLGTLKARACFANWLVNKIEGRLTYLRNIIADFICGVTK